MSMTDNIVNSARNQGIQQGIQQSMRPGIQQGMRLGIQQGMQQVIINMLHNGITIDQIVQLTSLNREKVEQAAQAVPSHHRA